MIKFFNFEAENLEKIAAAFPKYPIDNACLAQSPTGRIFQTEGIGMSLVIGKKEKIAIFDCEGSTCNFIETDDTVIANITEGSIALCDLKNNIHIIFVDGTSVAFTLEEFDYAQNLNNGFLEKINLPIFNIGMSYTDGKYEIDTTHAAWLVG